MPVCDSSKVRSVIVIKCDSELESLPPEPDSSLAWSLFSSFCSSVAVVLTFDSSSYFLDIPTFSGLEFFKAAIFAFIYSF